MIDKPHVMKDRLDLDIFSSRQADLTRAMEGTRGSAGILVENALHSLVSYGHPVASLMAMPITASQAQRACYEAALMAQDDPDSEDLRLRSEILWLWVQQRQLLFEYGMRVVRKAGRNPLADGIVSFEDDDG